MGDSGVGFLVALEDCETTAQHVIHSATRTDEGLADVCEAVRFVVDKLSGRPVSGFDNCHGLCGDIGSLANILDGLIRDLNLSHRSPPLLE